MGDLTVIMLTANKVPEQWANFHKEKLIEAIGDTPLITISSKPLDWGKNLIQTEYGIPNLTRQMLRGAKLADTTYIAIAEDDTLYPKEHFEFRPSLDSFGYNMNRWGIFSWGSPFYFYKPRICNGTMIAPRDLTIYALEKRIKKNPNDLYSRDLNDKVMEFYTYAPVVCFNHQFSVDHLSQRKRKKPWPVQAFDIPKWGRAQELRREFL